MKKDLVALIPELCLITGALVTLLVGSFSPRTKQWRARLVALAAAAAALATTIAAFATQPIRMIYEYGFAVDTATNAARLVVSAALMLLVAVAIDRVRDSPRESEFYVLMLLAGLGTILLAGATDLLVLQVALLLTSVPLYALVAWARDPLGTEAAMKLFLLGAFASVLMVTGITVTFGAAGTTSYRNLPETIGKAPPAAVIAGTVLILVGLLVKAGAVPLHFWLPDVTEGATSPAAAFVTTVPKIGALIAVFRLFAEPLQRAPMNWPLLIGVVAAATMTLGNLAAFWQTNVRRLLGYSTISQTGYILMAVAVAGHSDLALRSLLFYLAAYAAANLGAFAVVAEFPHATTLTDFSGLAWRSLGMTLTLTVGLLALVGTPPTAVFFGKLTTFTATADGGLGWLVAIAALNTVASLFYYLRWLAPSYLRPPTDQSQALLQPSGRSAKIGGYTAGLAVLLLGLANGASLGLFTGPLAPE